MIELPNIENLERQLKANESRLMISNRIEGVHISIALRLSGVTNVNQPKLPNHFVGRHFIYCIKKHLKILPISDVI